MKLTWETKEIKNATHIVDDGGMIYWTVAPGLTSDQVAKAFASHYDGTLGEYSVTDVATGNETDYSA